jgi:hypothetical protein
MLTHGHDLGDNCLVGPLNTENLRELLQVLGRSLTDGENGVTEPAHAQAAELLVEELDAELRGKKGNVFDNSETDTPLLVLGELDNGGEKGLRKELNADDYSD